MLARHPRQQKASKIYVKAQRLRQLLRGNNSLSTDRVVNSREMWLSHCVCPEANLLPPKKAVVLFQKDAKDDLSIIPKYCNVMRNIIDFSIQFYSYYLLIVKIGNQYRLYLMIWLIMAFRRCINSSWSQTSFSFRWLQRIILFINMFFSRVFYF